MNVVGTVILSLAAGTLPAAVISGFFMFKVNRATATKVLAEAEDISRNTALNEAKAAVEFSHRAYESVRDQCDTCLKRLAAAEERMHLSEARERRITAALRAIIRVIDENDPTKIGAAIAAAKELI